MAIRISLGALLVLICVARTPAAPIRFDVNDNDAVANPPGNPAPSPTQSGWTGITQTGLLGVASDFGSLNVSFVPIIGATVPVLDDRDRGQLQSGAHPLSNLLRDLIYITANPAVQGNGTLDVVVAGLAAGHYKFTGYFHDNTVNHNLVDLEVSVNGGVSYIQKVDNAATSTTTNPATVGTASFYFTANGTDTVRFRVIGQGGTVNFATSETAILSGFEIDVPEPTSILLAIIALASLGAKQVIRRRASARV